MAFMKRSSSTRDESISMLREAEKGGPAPTLRSPNLTGGHRCAIEVRALKSVLKVIGVRSANNLLVVRICAPGTGISSAFAGVGEESLTVLNAKSEIAETVGRSFEFNTALEPLYFDSIRSASTFARAELHRP